MQTKQDGRLGTEKIGKLMLELALPSVLAQIVNVLYNIVDRIYIGRIPDVGSLALTGVGVTFPIITIISAFAGFASGGGASSCRHRTRTEKPGPRRKNSWKLHFPAALFLRVSDGVFLFFQTPLLYLFGASSNTIRYASTYISHLSCRNRICRAGCRIEYFYQLSGTRTHGHVLRSHWRCYQHWSCTRFSSSFFIWVFPGPHLLPFSPRL